MASDQGDERPSHEATFAMVEAGEAFVREMRRRSASRDWRRVLGEMKKALEQIAACEMVASDPEASAILEAMTDADDMEELDHLAGLLNARVAVLVEERLAGPDGEPLPAPAPPTGEPSTFARAANQISGGRRGRTLLKL